MLALGVSTPLLAQSAAQASASAAQASASSGQDIVVTAEKRTATVQTAPLSITALSGKQLQAQGITGLEDIVRTVPGISMRTNGPGQTEIEIRGLASSGGSAPTVGYYLDETPLSPPAASLNGKVVLSPDLYDLNRVEVLRGPQGTLYGSGSMGGTVKLVTNAPELNTFGGSVDLAGSGTAGGGVNGAANAALNIPLVKDVVALRLVASETYNSGWIDRVVGGANFPLETDPTIGELNIPVCPGAASCVRGNVLGASVVKRYRNVNWNQTTSGRASLLIQPSAGFSINLTGVIQGIRAGGYNTYDQNPGTTAHYQPADLAEPFSDSFKMVSAVVKYQLPTIDLTSSTSYFTKREIQTLDTTEQFQVYFNLPFFPANTNIEYDTSRQFSTELRAASRTSSPFQWVGGVFYSSMVSHYIAVNESPSVAPLSTGGAAANPTGIIFDSDNPYKIRQFAAFGEASYKITPALKFTAGVRYFNFKTDASFHENGLVTGSGNAQYTDIAVSGAADGFDPKFNLSYIPNKDLTVYATLSKGFRPGGVNFPAPVSYCGVQPYTYNPDSVWNYEAGEKARLFGGAVTINADIYYLKWQGVQQSVVPACAYVYTVNAGSAQAYGPEIELTAKLSPNFTFTFNGSQTTSRLTAVPAGLGLSVGQPTLNIPSYTINSAIEYHADLAGDYRLVARLSGGAVGRTYDINYYTTRLPAYQIGNARVSVTNGGKTFAVFANNFTNTHAQLGINNSIGAYPTAALTRVTSNQPATFGVEISARY